MVANVMFLCMALLAQHVIGFAPPSRHAQACLGRCAPTGTGASTDTRMQRYSSKNQNIELENEEPLSVLFQRGLVLQRCGNLDESLQSYDLFLKAAQQCQVDPFQYAEVHVNVGAIHLRQQQLQKAKHHFCLALQHRPLLGTAHVNLAVVALQEASLQTDQQAGLVLLEAARNRCIDAMALNDEENRQSKAAAAKLLEDIDRMIQQTNYN